LALPYSCWVRVSFEPSGRFPILPVTGRRFSDRIFINAGLSRGRAFTSDEREVAEAARLYRLAYIARCEHSDTVLDLIPGDPDHSSAALLRSMT
jgi:hypothetical protein